MENEEQASNHTRGLYVIGRVAPTSLALEVAHHMKSNQVRLQIASFYSTEYDNRSIPIPLLNIDAEGRFDLRGAWRLCKCISRFRPDIIHVHHTVSAFWAAIFGKLLGAKVVRSEHSNSQYHTIVQRVINTVSRSLSDLVICNSYSTYSGFSHLQKYLVGDKWKVIYNGIDLERIENSSSQHPPFRVRKGKKVINIGSVGRLIDHKNYSRLIEAFSQVLSKTEKDIRLILIGEGRNRPHLESKIHDLGLSERVTLTGEVDREKVYSALYEFDVFVMPSLSEGFCNAAVEAMAVGVPLVCSDIPTLREVVGDVAVYANPKSTSEIAEAIIRLLGEDKETLEERGNEARRRAVSRYSIKSTAKRYLESYIEQV